MEVQVDGQPTKRINGIFMPKEDKKGNDEEQIPNGKEIQTNKTAYSKTAQANSSFPADDHQAIQKKLNKISQTNRKRTNTDN